jgi:hypothetical protein
MRRHKEEPVPSKPKPLFEIPEEDFIKPLQMMQRPQKEKCTTSAQPTPIYEMKRRLVLTEAAKVAPE